MTRGGVRGIGLALVAAGLLLLLLAHWPASARAEGDHVALIKLDGVIDAVSERFISRAIDKAADDGAALIVIELDTPGGRADSMRDIIEAILGSRAPLAVYVSPAGARAASAGTFITAAANFAVMAPTTNIGAAAPVSSGGELPPTLQKKVNEDILALIRGISERRNRNAAALEDTVTSALAYSADEALEIGIIDLIATDLGDLLSQVEGRPAETASGSVEVSTAGLPVREVRKTMLERFLGLIADPNIAYLLLSLGSLALLAEFFSPGVFGPGVVGVLALLLAFVAVGLLPVSWVGVALILFAMGLFYFELQAPGIGAFGAGGVVSFLVGSFLLFGGFFESSVIPEPAVEVNRWLIGGMTAALVLALLTILNLAREGGSADAFVGTPDEALIGARGVALSDLAPSGTVRIGDREWSATTEEWTSISAGREVRVISIYSGGVIKVSDSFPETGPRTRMIVSAVADRIRRTFRRDNT
ncbi:MAG: nodulation protein NfeD [Chloroflexi bacterium]|nr:nodulation protein NfeD [Chloroflexota bacterium]